MTRFAYLSLALFAGLLHWLLLHPLLADQNSTSADEIDAGIWIFICCWIALEAYWVAARNPAPSEPAAELADKRAALWTRMKAWIEGEAQEHMTRDEAQAAANRHARQLLENMAIWPTSDDHMHHWRDALLYGCSAYRTFTPTMRIRMHRGSIDAARKTEELIPATTEAVRAYLVRHDWPEAMLGELEVNEYSLTPAHGWEKHYIILLSKIPVGWTNAPVDTAPVMVAVDLANPGTDHTAIAVAARRGGKDAAWAIEQILAAEPPSSAPPPAKRPSATLRARRRGKTFIYDRVGAAA